MDSFIKIVTSRLLTGKLILSHTNDFLGRNIEIFASIDPGILSSVKKIIYINNKARDLEWIKYFPNVDYINVSYNKLTSLEWLKYIPRLTKLHINNNYINSLECLKYVPYLIYLRCSNNFIKTTTSLKFVKYLQVLICEYNPIKQITLLYLKYLTKVCLSNCKLTKLIVHKLFYCRFLNCSRNRIKTLILKDMPNLNKLICSNNCITIIEGLEYLTALTFLYCSDNNILSLNNIFNCSKLQVLLCHHNLLVSIPNRDYLAYLEIIYYDAPIQFKNIDDNTECMICLDTLEMSSFNNLVYKLDYFSLSYLFVKISISCNHIFHNYCINNWFNQSAACPLCRREILMSI